MYIQYIMKEGMHDVRTIVWCCRFFLLVGFVFCQWRILNNLGFELFLGSGYFRVRGGGESRLTRLFAGVTWPRFDTHELSNQSKDRFRFRIRAETTLRRQQISIWFVPEVRDSTQSVTHASHEYAVLRLAVVFKSAPSSPQSTIREAFVTGGLLAPTAILPPHFSWPASSQQQYE